ncbi:gastrula zinc finger protein XlCGF8.2DB-like [Entelurus aequoreus]|uniref:gastrula zinc finger protein XlCGF8.2DB-like n=1 Tax=Entelurus aequoreus TaxID=161455 RepID=UPI002B1DF791|nr:gastrula zinc finger protein XlCGF8.2DB-like [Entelurus aequoreus]XP_061922280.1 gastrula zinc finger protein XlCGF8.2DB-like [Entelurus aequoreus]XP_061922290.1 gastrula zinc finger protein XlCGF8.2DB-like [Entelurus aequoreus]
MCKVEMLRVLVKQRLTAAVEEIFVVLERTIAEYEEELSRTKEENERQRQLLDALFSKHQQADVSEEHLPLEQQEWNSRLAQEEPQTPHIKEEYEEPQPPYLKVEKEDDHVSQEGGHRDGFQEFPVIGGEVKGESAERREAEPPSSSSTQHTTDGNTHFRCSPYQKSIVSERNLNQHMTAHKGVKPFKCLVCGKDFGRSYELKIHMRKHTGEKPYTCTVCAKGFSQKGHFTAHARIHTGEKPFTCSLCGKSFVRNHDLKLHVRRHVGEKRYSCLICSKRFCDRTPFVIHMRTHTGEKVFRCGVCDQRFAYKYQLDNHKCVDDASSRK